MASQEMKKTLWEAADKLRAQMDAAEYKHLVLGLIFLKYVSDSFDERRREVADAPKNSARAYREAEGKQFGGLVCAGFGAGEVAADGEDDSEEVEVSAGRAGRGDGDGVGSGKGVIRGLG